MGALTASERRAAVAIAALTTTNPFEPERLDLVEQRRAGPGLSGHQHQSGTCRMGADPKTSVVDPWGRVHDVDNVFVVDASVHVTNGGFNPVLTIFALAFRTGAYIVREWQRGGLR